MGEPHIGLILPNYGDALDAERLASVAVIAEEAGFDSGWVTDHLIVPAELAPVYGTIAEALVSLGFLAGRTRRLQLGVSALVVPQRNPYVTLKQLTSLDFLSGGRIVMAVAAGWIEKEFETLGSPFEGRGRRLDDWLQLARSAFAQVPGPIDHMGGLPIADGWLAPALARSAGIEMWIAGVSDATLRRATQTGVWHPVALPTAQLSELATRFRDRRPDGRIVLRLSTLLADEPDPQSSDERGRHAVAGPRNGSRSASPSTSRGGATASWSISATTFLGSRIECNGSPRRSGRRSSARIDAVERTALAHRRCRVNAIDPGVLVQTDGLALHAELPPPSLAVVTSRAVLILQRLAALWKTLGLKLGADLRAPPERGLESAPGAAKRRGTFADELRLDGGEGAFRTA